MEVTQEGVIAHMKKYVSCTCMLQQVGGQGDRYNMQHTHVALPLIMHVAGS